jgi:hypothetical protein
MVAGLIHDEVLDFFFNLTSPSGHSMALGFIRYPTVISTRNLLGGDARPALKPDNLTAICEPIV